MKTTIALRSVACAAGVLAATISLGANEPPLCERIFLQVRHAVEQEPQKVLIIVEDEMVANEPCACEIVRGAIAGSHADAALRQQIVLTATHVAPQMGRIIAECAGVANAPGGGKGVVETVKQDIDVQPAATGASGESGSDYGLIPGDIRGVYLIQPATGGFATTVSTKSNSSTSKKSSHSHRSTSSEPTPQSPSVAQGP